jgi:fatty-acyl-CoA synthase
VLARAGVLRPYPPLRLARVAATLRSWGIGPAGGFASMTVLCPDRPWIVDELGTLTFAELDERGNRLADSLLARGVGAGDGIAVLCRNHRGFVDVSLAAAKIGADVVYVNTAFAGPQLTEVLERESPVLLVHDSEFAPLLGDAHGIPRLVAWVDEPDGPDDLGGPDDPVATVESLIRAGAPGPHPAPRRTGRVLILTSGTTGSPKGAPRREPGIEAATALLSRLPLRAGWRSHVAAPLFHTWGWAHLVRSTLLGSTIVLRRRFDPEDCLRAVTEEACESLVVVPVMLQRILALPAQALDSYDLSGVRVVAASGSSLPGDLAAQWMNRFGDHLYNVYGSTEVAYATVASPADLREAPGTAGRPPFATVVRILDADGVEVAEGGSGRIFVGNGLLFEGYTGGGGKDRVGGLMATGDVGHLDAEGRLVVEGRDDEMIVSGGENVFPAEVEDALARHDAVVEAAAVGVEDEEYGQRLRAFVVLREGAEVTEAELKDHVRGSLAGFKVPREIVFVERLPRNATGKVVKSQLDPHPHPPSEETA